MLNDYVLPLLVNVLSYVASIIFFSSFLEKRKGVRPAALAMGVLFFSILLFAFNSLHLTWVNSVSGCALIFIVALLFFKGNHAGSFILSVILITMSVASELIVVLAIVGLSGIRQINLMNVSGSANTRWLQSISLYNSALVSAVMLIMIVVALARIFPQKRFHLSRKDLLVILFPVFALCVTYFMLHITSRMDIPPLENIFMLLLQIGLLSSSVAVFFIYIKIIDDYAVKEENRLLQNQIGYYQYQFEQIKTSQAVIGKIEHDIEKHLLALKLDLKNAMPLEAEQKIDLLIGNLRIVEHAADSGNADFDAILNYKAKQAAAFGIRMVCDLRLPYTMNMNTTDLSVILGNAIDNAIEACQAAESSERIINISISYEKPNLHMTFANPLTGEIKTDAAGEIVTTKPGGKHGIGLKSIRDTVEKYDGLLDIATKKKQFILKILLFNLQSQ